MSVDTPSENDLSINRIEPNGFFGWLRLAVEDVRECHVRSLFYGVCFVLMGLGLESAHAANPVWLLTLVAGFMLLGPILAAGLYELSRQVERHEHPDMLMSLFCWCRNPRQLCTFSLLCIAALAMLAWASGTLLGTLSSSSLMQALSNRWSDGIEGRLAATAWVSVWVLLALLIFTASAISVPSLVDHRISAFRAIGLSLRCCALNPLAFFSWATFILVTIGLSLKLGHWPLLITGPLIGHATWHAYRACTDRRHG